MWENWGRNQNNPLPVARPSSLNELRQVIDTQVSPRIVGSGHSFTPLVSDASAVISLQDLPDTSLKLEADKTAWLNANARLKDLSPKLGERALAFRNLGDINEQTLAGAVSTATHGTGETLPCLSAEIHNVKLMLSSGEIVDTSTGESPDLLDAAKVSLGALGVLLEAQVALVPKYYLRRRAQIKPLEYTLNHMHKHWATHRNFEFFYIPWSQKTLCLRHDVSEGPSGRAPRDLDNLAVYGLKLARFLGRLHPTLRRKGLALLAALQSEEDYAGESWQVLCSQRDVRFVEMEYHVPPEMARDVLIDVIERTEKFHPDVFFPIEVRKTAGDSAWLSPFQGGPRVSIAIHSTAQDRYADYFSDIEPIFRAAGGRPHWGKLHSLKSNDLFELYPDFDRFCALREKLDPQGKFLSPYMRDLFVRGV